jgi:hypothetical protein
MLIDKYTAAAIQSRFDRYMRAERLKQECIDKGNTHRVSQLLFAQSDYCTIIGRYAVDFMKSNQCPQH